MMTQFQLPNKLKVFVVENNKAPVVTLQAWVRTGSADEVKGQEGLSHFIEHLLFKGTKKYNVGEIAKLIEAAGGELNAYTSFDQTVFYMTLSSEYVDLALDTLSEMVGRAKFDKFEVDNEREVVIEEIKRSNDSPSRQSSQMLFTSVYKNHPYNRPVIGYDHVVQKTPVPKIIELFRSRYCPENMFLIVAGNIKYKDLKPKIINSFSDLKGKLKKVKRPSEPKSTQPIVKQKISNFKESYLNLAFKTPKVSEKEIAALDLLSYILSQGETSRLIQVLRIQNQLVNDFGASYFEGKDPGFFVFTAYLNPKNIIETLNKITDEILSLIVSPPSDKEILKNIQHILSHEDYQETIDSIARKIGHYEFMYKDPNYFNKYIQIMKSLTPKDLSDIIKKFFKPENLAITLLSSENTDLNQWVKDYSFAFNSFSKIISEEKNQKIIHTDLNKKRGTPHKSITEKTIAGSKVIFVPIPETQVISCRLGFLGGLRADPLTFEGTSEMLAKTWTSGTKTRSEQEVAASFENYSSSLSAFSGRNSMGLHLMTLSRYQDKVFDSFSDVLINPSFPEFSFGREKEILLNNIKSLEDHPSHLVFMQFMSALFDGHPYQSETFGSEETLNRIGISEIQNMYNKIVNAQNLVTVIAGGYDASFWEDKLQATFEKLKKGQKFEKSFPHESPLKSKTTFRSLQKEQSHIVYGFKGLSMTDPDRFALNVLQTILSGQGGRLFLNLRDKASLAYSVSPVRMDGLETGYFGAYIGCSPEKGEKAIQMMKVEFDRLMQEKVPEEEILRAQKNIIGKNDISLQKTSNVSSHILFDVLYGMPVPNHEDYKKKIFDVSAKDIQRVAERILGQSGQVIAAIGPKKPF